MNDPFKRLCGLGPTPGTSPQFGNCAGQRAMTEEELQALAIRDARGAANFKPDRDYHLRIQNANPYRMVDGEPEPVAPLTRWQRFKLWLFGA